MKSSHFCVKVNFRKVGTPHEYRHSHRHHLRQGEAPEKTSTAAGLAACLAAMGHRTLCLDGDVGLRNLDLTLGMTDQALMDFTDVIQGRCSLRRPPWNTGRSKTCFCSPPQ